MAAEVHALRGGVASSGALDERFLSLLALEGFYSANPCYVDHVQVDGLNWEWRRRLAAWIREFTDDMAIGGAALSTAMNIVDRYLSLRSCAPDEFKLLGLATILIVGKLLGSPVRVADLVDNGAGYFNADTIRNMELQVCQVLEWRITPPCVHEMARILLQLVPEPLRDILTHAVDAFGCFTALEHEYLRFRRSDVAVALITAALEAEQITSFTVGDWCESLRVATGTSVTAEAQECAQMLVHSCREMLGEDAEVDESCLHVRVDEIRPLGKARMDSPTSVTSNVTEHSTLSAMDYDFDDELGCSEQDLLACDEGDVLEAAMQEESMQQNQVCTLEKKRTLGPVTDLPRLTAKRARTTP